MKYGLTHVKELLDVTNKKPEDLVLVITGRSAHPDVMARADFVTEMKEIKHYYKAGVKAILGIDK